ncbi:hypothetical protein TNCV_3626241 [Trichonephila clavipes]|nr:hypothetical protein TNCV_3626241 [Trichonephila clavipes]
MTAVNEEREDIGEWNLVVSFVVKGETKEDEKGVESTRNTQEAKGVLQKMLSLFWYLSWNTLTEYLEKYQAITSAFYLSMLIKSRDSRIKKWHGMITKDILFLTYNVAIHSLRAAIEESNQSCLKFLHIKSTLSI